MKYGTHLEEIPANKLTDDFVLGQLEHEAGRGNAWTALDSLSRALGQNKYFTTTDLQLILKDLVDAEKIVKERKRAGVGMASKVIDHYALK